MFREFEHGRMWASSISGSNKRYHSGVISARCSAHNRAWARAPRGSAPLGSASFARTEYIDIWHRIVLSGVDAWLAVGKYLIRRWAVTFVVAIIASSRVCCGMLAPYHLYARFWCRWLRGCGGDGGAMVCLRSRVEEQLFSTKVY